MFQRLLCKLGWCKKPKAGSLMFAYDNEPYWDVLYKQAFRCPHCKMGYWKYY